MIYLFRFFSHWPLPALHAVGAALGWLVWCLSPSYRAQFRANVAQAGLAFAAARPAIAEAGRFVAELPKLWMRPPAASCLGNVRVEGRGHADQAFALGKGVIFLARTAAVLSSERRHWLSCLAPSPQFTARHAKTGWPGSSTLRGPVRL